MALSYIVMRAQPKNTGSYTTTGFAGSAVLVELVCEVSVSTV